MSTGWTVAEDGGGDDPGGMPGRREGRDRGLFRAVGALWVPAESLETRTSGSCPALFEVAVGGAPMPPCCIPLPPAGGPVPGLPDAVTESAGSGKEPLPVGPAVYQAARSLAVPRLPNPGTATNNLSRVRTDVNCRTCCIPASQSPMMMG